VLHTLRDALTVDQAAKLGAQMPLLIRGIYYHDWKPASMPHHMRTADDFLAVVRERLGNTDLDTTHACRAVFNLLNRRISDGEINDVRHVLHHSVRAIWLHNGEA
jgi:uncharacterized protein (DUF2267 family)